MEQQIREIFDELDRWITINRYKGYDPFDIWAKSLPKWSMKHGSKTITKGKPKKLAKLLRTIIYGIDFLFPEISKMVYCVEREENPKAYALLMSSYLNMYNLTGEERYIQKTEYILKKLMELANYNYGGIGWGYPFDWQFLEYIPRKTPSSVVTSFVGNAILNLYRITENKNLLKTLEQIGFFMINGLNIRKVNKNAICFSYTPLDDSYVINANALVSSLLFQIYQYIPMDKFLNLAEKALNYTLDSQEENGLFYYYGREEGIRGKIDHYHNVYIYLSLKKIYETTHYLRVNNSIEKWEKSYINELFTNCFPKYDKNNIFPISSHVLSNAIIALSGFSISPKIKCRLKKTLDYTINNFYSNKGYFYYKIEKIGPIKICNKFPYMRWTEAWFHLALSTYLNSKWREVI